jgi:tetratricopeptide (TPR) repeat protein
MFKMNWQEISQIRKNGDYLRARDLARVELQNFPNSLQLKSQIEWTYYSEIKEITTKLKQTDPVDQRLVQQLIKTYEDYIKGETRRPEMAFSMILQLISPYAIHFPDFYNYVHWFGKAALRAEDWEVTTYIDKQGKERSNLPVAYEVSRGLCKWAKTAQDLKKEQADFCLEWANQARSKLSDEDAIWLDWDAVAVLRRMGNYENASQVLSSVLKLKKSEFWVWAEAARIYQFDQEDLALACFCKAMLCKTEEKFLVTAHLDFAKLLISLEMFDEASFEINQSIKIRNENQWKLPEELNHLIQSNWFDPNKNDLKAAKEFYEEHASDALSLCFDEIRKVSATYLGQLKIKREGKKPKEFAKFSIKNGNKFESLLANGFNHLKMKKGAPVLITLGIQEDSNQNLVVNVVEQMEGEEWGCTNQQFGVISYISDDYENIKVFLNKDQELKLDQNILRGLKDKISIGSKLKCFSTINAKTQRVEISHLELANSAKISDMKEEKGELRKNPKGFGFVNDIFISPNLIKNTEDKTLINVQAIFSKQRDKDTYSWKAISIS